MIFFTVTSRKNHDDGLFFNYYCNANSISMRLQTTNVNMCNANLDTWINKTVFFKSLFNIQSRSFKQSVMCVISSMLFGRTHWLPLQVWFLYYNYSLLLFCVFHVFGVLYLIWIEKLLCFTLTHCALVRVHTVQRTICIVTHKYTNMNTYIEFRSILINWT